MPVGSHTLSAGHLMGERAFRYFRSPGAFARPGVSAATDEAVRLHLTQIPSNFAGTPISKALIGQVYVGIAWVQNRLVFAAYRARISGWPQ